MPTPFYLDWNFWTAVLALGAIVLSQLPPVRLLLRPKKLEVEVHSRINITHQVGNPNVGLVVSIRNTGGRDLRVRGLWLDIQRDGQPLVSLPGMHYFETPSAQSSVLFVPFALKPGEAWAHSVQFLNYFDRPTEKGYREGVARLAADIRTKIKARPEGDPNPVIAEQALVAPFFELFRRLFVWLPGEYVANLRVIAEPGSASYSKAYRFTLFESDTKDLGQHLEDYPYGGGLTYKVEQHGGVWAPLTEHAG